MAEPHYRFLGGALALHVLGGARGIADLLRHPHHVLRRAAVRGTGKRSDGCGDRRVQIRLGAGDHARGERRSVRAVLGVQDHVHVHEARRFRSRALSLQHVQEVGGMAQSRIRRHRRAAVADVIVRSDDHRHLRREPETLAQRGRGRVVGHLGVEGRERRDRGAQHVHRMGTCERADDVVRGGRQRARGLQLRVERFELGACRQLAVEEQVAGFLERRALGQVVDRIAAIEEFTGAAVDEADARAVEIHALQTAMHFDLLGIFGHGHSPGRSHGPVGLVAADIVDARRARTCRCGIGWQDV